MDASLKRKLKKALAVFRRIGLKNTNFSIISNNCWGGYVYDYFGLQYRSPTIGLYMMSEDYIKFIKNLNYYLSCDLKEIEDEDIKEKSWYIQSKAKVGHDFPIAKLDDIKVIFLHYHTFQEAKEKWNRRKKRINFKNLVVKFNDQNNFTKNNLEEFMELDYKNKLFLLQIRII